MIAAKVQRLGPRVIKGQEGDVKYQLFVKDFVLEGAVTVTGFGSFSVDGCTGGEERGWVQYPNPAAG